MYVHTHAFVYPTWAITGRAFAPAVRSYCITVLHVSSCTRVTFIWYSSCACVSNKWRSHPKSIYEQGIHPNPGPQHVHYVSNIKSLNAHWRQLCSYEFDSFSVQETWLTRANISKIRSRIDGLGYHMCQTYVNTPTIVLKTNCVI